MPPSLSVLQTAVTAPPTTVVSITIPVTVPPIDTGATPNTIIANINAVEQAVNTSADNFRECFRDPASCKPGIIYAPGSPALDTLQTFIADAVAKGQYLSADRRGSLLTIGAVSFPTASEAVATVCNFDAGITLGPIASDGRPKIVDDRAGSFRTKRKLVVVDGKWMVSAITNLENLGDGNKCG